MVNLLNHICRLKLFYSFSSKLHSTKRKNPACMTECFSTFVFMKTNTLFDEQARKRVYASESFNSFNLFLTEVSICVSPTLKI